MLLKAPQRAEPVGEIEHFHYKVQIIGELSLHSVFAVKADCNMPWKLSLHELKFEVKL